MESRHIAWQQIGAGSLAVGGGGLLGLFLLDKGQPALHLSAQGWFGPLLVFLAVLTVLGLYGLFAPVVGFPLPPTRTEPFWRRGTRLKTEPISTDPTNALSVSLEEEQWSNFRHEARILKLKIAIYNRTGSPVEFDGTSLRGSVPPRIQPGGQPVRGLQEELARLAQELPPPPGVIGPGRTEHGWFLQAIGYHSEMGEPNYEFRIHSSKGGHEYGFRRVGNPKQPIAATAAPVPAVVAAPLQIRHGQQGPYTSARFPNRPSDVHAVGVYNPIGNPVAEHVRVEIIGMDPWPKNDRGRRPTFNTLLPLKRTGVPGTGVRLAANGEDYWEMAKVSRDGDGNFYVQGIAVANWLLERSHFWDFERDEDWRLHYQAWSDNVPGVEFVVRMLMVEGNIQCRLEGV